MGDTSYVHFRQSSDTKDKKIKLNNHDVPVKVAERVSKSPPADAEVTKTARKKKEKMPEDLLHVVLGNSGKEAVEKNSQMMLPKDELKLPDVPPVVAQPHARVPEGEILETT